MQKICRSLELDYMVDFQNLFSVFQFSGDSGRSGDVIEARPRREVDVNEVNGSELYIELAFRLNYASLI